MNKHSLIACLLLACTALPAGARDLLLVEHFVDRATLIDRDSIERSGERAQAWLFTSFERSVPAADGMPAHRSIRTRLAFDCRRQRLGPAERVYHEQALGRGKVVARERLDEPLRLGEPVSALDHTLLAMACGS